MLAIKIYKHRIDGPYVGFVRKDGSVYETHFDLGDRRIGRVSGNNIHDERDEAHLAGIMKGKYICIGDHSVGKVESGKIISFLKGGTGGKASSQSNKNLIGGAGLLLGLIKPSPILVRRFQMKCPRCAIGYDSLVFDNINTVSCQNCGWVFREPLS